SVTATDPPAPSSDHDSAPVAEVLPEDPESESGSAPEVESLVDEGAEPDEADPTDDSHRP
ncbi:MAG: hypothetical protein L0J13_13290, partial [Brevibacterium sp.]|nr:hypothetical protein [Brevibacterium sp.]